MICIQKTKSESVVEEKSATDDLEDESYEMEIEQDSAADKMKVKEAKKKKSGKNKQVKSIFHVMVHQMISIQKDEFFEESPPFNPDQVFSDMKISRPLLKVD